MLIVEGESMKFTELIRYRTNAWIFMYIEKYNEDERNVRYRYFLDTDDIDKAGAIEISKDIQFMMSDHLYKKMELIEGYFEKGMIKIIQIPTNITDQTEKIEDYNAVYAAKTIIEYHYWTGVYDQQFFRVATNHFETYAKKYSDFLDLIDDRNNDLDLIQYEREFVKDDWLFIKIEKIYEDEDTLKYRFYVDTADEDDYSIMEFSKKIKIKSFTKYIYLYDRFLNKGLLKINKIIDTHTVEDIVYNRRSAIALKYILDHRKENDYISQSIIINEKVYDYYDEVTQAIDHLEFKNEDNVN